MMKRWKLLSLTLIIILGVLVFINNSTRFSRSVYLKYNNFQETFHDNYLTLQEERVRVAAIAHNGGNYDEIIAQLEVMHKQANRTYDIMVQMYEVAFEIALIQEDQALLVSPVYAGALQDFGKNVIWNLPLIGRLAHGFDTTTDSIRLGLYRAYDSGIEGDQEIIEELMRKRGVKTRKELLTALPKDITWIFSHVRSTEASPTVSNEVNLAEVAVKGGVAAVKAYFDGILLVTGGKTINLQSEMLKQLGVSSDLQSFVKMGLGNVTGEEYLKGKAKEQFLKVYEYVLTPEELNSVVSEDSDEIRKILARAKGMEKEEQKETTKMILALSQKALNLAVEVVENNDIEKDTPYHEWSSDAQRELAQKLNAEEENGPLLVSGKSKSAGVTQYLVPPGMWNILTSSKGTFPHYIYDIEKEKGKTGSIISLTTRLANAKLARELLEQESLTYEQLDELGILTSEDIVALNSQQKKESGGINKLLQSLRSFVNNPPWNDDGKPQEDTNDYEPRIQDFYVDEPDSFDSRELCVEDWECEDWGSCTDGKQTRVCSDYNECWSEVKLGRPIRTVESQDCQGSLR